MGNAADWTFRVARVEVVDWADAGDLYEGPMNEDGERPIRRPDREAVVVVEDARGELFTYNGRDPLVHFTFGEDFEAAEKLAARIREAGKVRGEFWRYWRTVYGSTAYQEDGLEELAAQREREEARGEAIPAWCRR